MAFKKSQLTILLAFLLSQIVQKISLFPTSWLYFALFSQDFQKTAELRYVESTDLFGPKKDIWKPEAARDTRDDKKDRKGVVSYCCDINKT